MRFLHGLQKVQHTGIVGNCWKKCFILIGRLKIKIYHFFILVVILKPPVSLIESIPVLHCPVEIIMQRWDFQRSCDKQSRRTRQCGGGQPINRYQIRSLFLRLRPPGRFPLFSRFSRIPGRASGRETLQNVRNIRPKCLRRLLDNRVAKGVEIRSNQAVKKRDFVCFFVETVLGI